MEVFPEIDEKLKEIEVLCHNNGGEGIPLVVAFYNPVTNEHTLTVFTQKEDTTPLLYLLGMMLYCDKGLANESDFHDAFYQYKTYVEQDSGQFDRLLMESEDVYTSIVQQVLGKCNELMTLVESLGWDKPFFITFEETNPITNTLTRHTFTFDFLFQRVPAFNIVMYLAKYHTVEAAYDKFKEDTVTHREQVEQEMSIFEKYIK